MIHPSVKLPAEYLARLRAISVIRQRTMTRTLCDSIDALTSSLPSQQLAAVQAVLACQDPDSPALDEEGAA